MAAAPDRASDTRPGKPGRLRQKLMQLSMTLTGVGVVLLAVSLIAVVWLRTHSNHLALERAPAVVATQRAQIGLQRSLAGLRGWVALGDEQFRADRRAALTEQIDPAIAELRRRFETVREEVLDQVSGETTDPKNVQIAHELSKRLLDVALAQMKDGARRARSEEALDREYQRFLENL